MFAEIKGDHYYLARKGELTMLTLRCALRNWASCLMAVTSLLFLCIGVKALVQADFMGIFIVLFGTSWTGSIFVALTYFTRNFYH